MDIAGNLKTVKANIKTALERSGRADLPLIIAVTKTHPPEILEQLLALGIEDTGENYVQEMLGKMEKYPDFNWHYVGGLQRNKAKYIVGKVCLIHSVDNIALAAEIDKRAAAANIIQNVFVQINQGEETKGGVAADAVESLARDMNGLKNVNLKGLMAMPPYSDDPEDSRPYFKQAREIRDHLNKQAVYKNELKELSMGMSGDYAVAVEEGATMLRIGTALLGTRE
jgi:pyridoxal phosphate enzyme (YggS family)